MNHVVGHVGSVLSVNILWTFPGSSIVQPSASCSTGPSPFTRFTLDIVSGITPFVLNWDENPPPLKYPVFAGSQKVAFRHSKASFDVISQKGFIHDSPFRVSLPEKSRAEAPELIRWMIPFRARPEGLMPVTRFMAAGLQYVRMSENIWAVLVRRYPKSIGTPFIASFSVATR